VVGDMCFVMAQELPKHSVHFFLADFHLRMRKRPFDHGSRAGADKIARLMIVGRIQALGSGGFRPSVSSVKSSARSKSGAVSISVPSRSKATVGRMKPW